MEMLNAWAPLAWAAAVVVTVLVALLIRSRRRSASSAVRVAHLDRVTELPGFRTARARLRVGLGIAIAVTAVAVAASAALTSRIVTVRTVTPEVHNRDIVLCLDTSGSMTDYDVAILDTFIELVDEFEGERIGLTIFNASAVTYFPLTTDYDYVADQMITLRDNMEDPNTDYAYTDGTLLGDGSSLIGDGLASCTMRFDNLDDDRSRSIIFATDNFVAGKQLVSLPQAGQYAKDNGVVVYGLNPGDSTAQNYIEELAAELKDAVEMTGGEYFALSDPQAVPEIVHSIQEQEASAMDAPSYVVRSDKPDVFLWIAFCAILALLALGWRLRR
ncbi:vWA domain-containing protein [Paramicrobacterium agarici]|uniref:von Willebrand factor type A domain-containing protein n=1 Tax=Paramicrobacterium agarici TaxID=630514 RepID=A0A2A9DWA4_9MICO|nr:VWA domain-containing protein [Microbacterium agarici]PFG30968.1 von Willebrand factor type A domain-containing protein [Microbacterium agarici]